MPPKVSPTKVAPKAKPVPVRSINVVDPKRSIVLELNGVEYELEHDQAVDLRYALEEATDYSRY